MSIIQRVGVVGGGQMGMVDAGLLGMKSGRGFYKQASPTTHDDVGRSQ